ncbi:MAG: peptide deformylase [Gemmataceae bacterium]|nr:peptide deformylase [Gemmataceae bacterium]
MNIVLPPLKIVHWPHPSLRHKAVPLTEITPRVVRIAEEMLELMHEAKGLGLAAPQVGLPFQMFVADYAGDAPGEQVPHVFINPQIDDRRGSVEGEEGCLSFPGLYQKVRRAKTILGRAYDLKGRLVEVELSMLAARLWQHETDHLHGDLFIDRMTTTGVLGSREAIAEFERDYKKAQQRGEIPPDAEIEKRLTELEGWRDPGPPPPAL